MVDVFLDLEKSDYYHILWLKYVEDVDLSNHCMKSLLGVKSRKVHPQYRSGLIKLDESNADYFYMCGVVYPWNWSNNFHCAFKRAEGKEFTYSFRGTTVHVINAEQIPISNKWINPMDALAKNRLYSTCRNWQFANWFARNARKEPPKPKVEEPQQLELF